MNIVFLDIDGVLNNLGSVVGLGSPSKYFDPVSVALVEKLCEETGAQIVVSSSWRTGHAVHIKEDLRRCGAGCLASRYFGETPRLNIARGGEVNAWLRDNSIGAGRYVILDDDSDFYPGQPLVKTTFKDGFRFDHYTAAIRHLKPDHPHCNDRAVIVPASSES